jgi:hypothetical protein
MYVVYRAVDRLTIDSHAHNFLSISSGNWRLVDPHYEADNPVEPSTASEAVEDGLGLFLDDDDS